jgi:exonuclease SbcC
VRLANIRSHVRTGVEFVEGFNCIVGGVGEGKSSILLAVHFGLFGTKLGKSYDYLLREDQTTGEVYVTFEQAGKTYTILRALKREKERIVQDTNQLILYVGDKKLAAGKKAAVDEQLTAITGLDEGLFKEVVWIQQERLKELLNMEPSKRQETLDQLFRLADFQSAWETLREFEHTYERLKREFEQDPDIVGFQSLQFEYAKAHDEMVALQTSLEEIRATIETAKLTLQGAEETLKSLEELRERTEVLRQEESGLQARIKSIGESLIELGEKVKKRLDSLDRQKEALAQLRNEEKAVRGALLESGFPSEASASELDKVKAELERQIINVQASLEGKAEEIRDTDEKIRIIERESKCPFCFQPITEEYKGKLVAFLRDELKRSEESVERLQIDLATLNKKRILIAKAISNLLELAIKIEERQRVIEEESKVLNDLYNELEGKQRAEVDLQTRLSSVKEEIAKFDIVKLDVAKKAKEEASKHLVQLTERLNERENTLLRQSKLEAELKERLSRANEKIREKSRIERIQSVIGDLRDVYRTVTPHLRGEYVQFLTKYVQKVLDDMTEGSDRQYFVDINETYTPQIREGEYWREVSYVSGGERTLLAIAYKIGLGQLIMEARTGHGLDLLILDEPTESLGTEDGSIGRLAEAISHLRSVEQIIAVTHSEAFANRSGHLIRVRKEAGKSVVVLER